MHLCVSLCVSLCVCVHLYVLWAYIYMKLCTSCQFFMRVVRGSSVCLSVTVSTYRSSWRQRARESVSLRQVNEKRHTERIYFVVVYNSTRCSDFPGGQKERV